LEGLKTTGVQPHGLISNVTFYGRRSIGSGVQAIYREAEAKEPADDFNVGVIGRMADQSSFQP
jgi:hypothetical protein